MREIFIFLIVFINSLSSFNLDINAPIYKYGPPKTYFGYSVAQHYNKDKPVILVGAPRAESGQKDTQRTGAVYSCSLNTAYTEGRKNEWCEMVLGEYETGTTGYSKRPDQTAVMGKDVHYLGKNDQLLGASISSLGTPNGGAVMCAPLIRMNNNTASAQGACYELESDLSLKQFYSTCVQKNFPKEDRHNDYGACMEGISVKMTPNNLVTGVIGAKKWTGGVFAKYSKGDIFEKSEEKYTMMQEKGGIREMLTSHDYLGYSVTIGRFGFWHEDSSSQTIVSGATRSGQHGAVIFLPMDLKEHGNRLSFTGDKFVLNGTKMGSAYGYSVEALDINNDGFDDLVVGAPFEHRYDSDGQFGGIVYVYFSQGKKRSKGESNLVFHAPIVLKGPKPFSQFGLSITKLGNLDGGKNGANDFAVGAPYANDGKGSVYIYLGSKDPKKFRKKPAQVISGADLPNIGNKPMKSFGFSLAGGVDMDGNGYPDLVVGSVAGDMVTILRSRPVISTSSSHKTATKFIDIEKGKNCPRGANTCFPLDLSIIVDGENSRGADLVNLNGDVFFCTLEVVPFSQGVGPRALIGDNHSVNFTWPCGAGSNNRKQTYTRNIYIPSNEQSKDWINPLKFKFTVKLRDDRKPSMPVEGGRLVDLKQYPILNRYGASYEFSIGFETRCGDDHLCQTDLAMDATFVGIPNSPTWFVRKGCAAPMTRLGGELTEMMHRCQEKLEIKGEVKQGMSHIKKVEAATKAGIAVANEVKEVETLLAEEPMNSSIRSLSDMLKQGELQVEELDKTIVSLYDCYQEVCKDMAAIDLFDRQHVSGWLATHDEMAKSCLIKLKSQCHTWRCKMDKMMEAQSHHGPTRSEQTLVFEAENGDGEHEVSPVHQQSLPEQQILSESQVLLSEHDMSLSSNKCQSSIVNTPAFPALNFGNLRIPRRAEKNSAHIDVNALKSDNIENSLISEEVIGANVPTVEQHPSFGEHKEAFQPEMFAFLQESLSRTDRLIELFSNQMVNQERSTNMLLGASHQQNMMSFPRMRFPNLKDLPYPTFSGERPHEFVTFWNEFEASIGGRRDLKDSVKLQYLREALKKPAKGLIEGLQITDENYEYVVEELKKQYGSWVSVEKAYFSRLESLASKPVPLKATHLFKVFYEQRSLVRGLQEQSIIGIPHCQLIKKAYPWRFMERLVEKESEFKEKRGRYWDVDELFVNIKTWINVVQDKEENQFSESSDNESVMVNHVMDQPTPYRRSQQQFGGFQRNEFQRNSKFNNDRGFNRFDNSRNFQRNDVSRFQNQYTGSQQRNFGQQGQRFGVLRCYCCQQMGHRLADCLQYQTLQEREKALGDACKICCYRTNHTSENCFRAVCYKCGKKHCLALCPQMYTNGYFDKQNFHEVFRLTQNRPFNR